MFFLYFLFDFKLFKTLIVGHNITRNELISQNSKITVLLIGLCLIIGWNYWIPEAKNQFNLRYSTSYVYNIDFFCYYSAGKAFSFGYNPYEDNNKELGLMANPRGESNYSTYLYPPTLLPFFSLFWRIEYHTARALWLALNIILFIISSAIYMFMIDKKLRLTFIATWILLFITSGPLLCHIWVGQIDLLVISLILFSLSAYIKNYKWLSAILLSIAAITKIYPAVFLLYYVVIHKDYKYLLYISISAISLIGLSLLIIPLNLYQDYLTTIMPSIADGSFRNQSIYRFIRMFGINPKIISQIGIAIFTILMGYLGIQYRKSKKINNVVDKDRMLLEECLFFLNLLGVLMFSFISWHHVYVWIIFPSALLVSRVADRSKNWFLAMVIFSIALMNARITGRPVVNYLNLIGNLIMFMNLMLIITREKLVFLENDNKRMN